MGFFGGNDGPKTTTSTVTQVQQLSPQQQQLLNLALPRAASYVNNPPIFFPGSTVAPFTPLQREAQQGLIATAEGPAKALSEQTLAAQRFALGPVLFPETNPALRATAEAAVRPLVDNFQQTILPSIDRRAIAAGQFGGSRQGVAQGIAAQELARQVGDITQRIYSDAYQRGLQTLERGLLTAPGTTQLVTFPSQLLDVVGTREQQLAQALTDEAVRRFNFNQVAPFLAAKDVAGLAFGVGGGSTISQATQPLPQPNTGLQLLSGASTGAALFPSNPLLGAGIGALVSAIFS